MASPLPVEYPGASIPCSGQTNPIRPNKINRLIILDRNRSGNQGRCRRSQRMKSENLSDRSALLLMNPQCQSASGLMWSTKFFDLAVTLLFLTAIRWP